MRALLLQLLVCLLLPAPVTAMLEDQFLFFPDPVLHTTPTSAGLSYEEVHFAAADGTPLHGWYLPGGEGRPLVLFCHGNAGNIADRVEILRFLHDLGLAVFLFDYRGYGRSGGQTSEAGTYEDGRGALDWLAARGWRPPQMIFLGRSLGAAVALQLALERPPGGLVLESPFTSVAAMGRLHYPILYRVLGWVLEARYDSLNRIADLQAPLLIVHGSADRIVPAAMARELYSRAPEPKRLLLLPGVGHNDLFFIGHPDYRAAWLELIGESGPR